MRWVDRPRDPGPDRPRDEHERNHPPDPQQDPVDDLLWGRGGPLRGDQHQDGPPADQPLGPAATDGEREKDTIHPSDGAPDGLVAFLFDDPELPEPVTAKAEVPPADVVEAASETAWLVTDHAYDKHVERDNEFPEIGSREEFARMVDSVLRNPTESRELPRDRIIYWHEESEVVVIINNRAPDRSTAFRPERAKGYYDTAT
jgi:hypothetical protein